MKIVTLIFAILLMMIPVNAADRNADDFIGAAYKSRVVNCHEWISLRLSPSTDSERLTTIPLGTIVTVYDTSVEGINGFYPVEYNGLQGYCLIEYLEYYSDAGAPVR